MLDVMPDIARWRAEGVRVAVARVVQVEGSGPRQPGATMVVAEDGRVAGAISGGCVEGAVVAEALEALATGRCRVVTFGYSDADAFSVGLTCGGSVRVLVSAGLPAVYGDLAPALAAGEPVVLATVVACTERRGGTTEEDGPAPGRCFEMTASEHRSFPPGQGLLVWADGRHAGGLGSPDLDRVVGRDALGLLASGESAVRRYRAVAGPTTVDVEVFSESFVPPPRMVVVGAVDFAAALVRQAKLLGYHVTVCDPRRPFATVERFPQADAVVGEQPHRYLDAVGSRLGPRDAVCVLTHEAKFDVPAIMAALRTEVGYIGALGSRRTTADRRARLLDHGVDPGVLQRVRAPIGLDLGARTPEETALAICSEIVAVQTGHDAVPLHQGRGPIHAGPALRAREDALVAGST